MRHLTAVLLAAALLAAATSAAVADPFAAFAPVADAPTNRGMKPTRWVAFGRTHYYQVPPNPVGTVVAFHGCARAAKAFFPWNPEDCSECLGEQMCMVGGSALAARGAAWFARRCGVFSRRRRSPACLLASTMFRTHIHTRGMWHPTVLQAPPRALALVQVSQSMCHRRSRRWRLGKTCYACR